MRQHPTVDLENKFLAQGWSCVGVDEVGRGCLAGPVVTAAVRLPRELIQILSSYSQQKIERDHADILWWFRLRDSKQLSPARREFLAEQVWNAPGVEVEVAWCTPREIDEWNILSAAMVAMRKAAQPFVDRAEVLLVDGNTNPFAPKYEKYFSGQENLRAFRHVECVIKGDAKVLTIAAASVVAKVFRDQWLCELDEIDPRYGFAEHKGYSTPSHYAALARSGPGPQHRYSYAPIKELARHWQNPSGHGQDSNPIPNSKGL